MLRDGRPNRCFLFEPGLGRCSLPGQGLQHFLRETKPISASESEFPLKGHTGASGTGRKGEERVIQTSGRI